MTRRLDELRNYYDYFQNLGISVIQFGPIFESVSHGYDTIDYMKIDHRLGDNDLFRQIVSELHQLDIKVILDGVFNHTSRQFDAFSDIRTYGEKSWRRHWYHVDFSDNGNNPYHDGFDYKNWEGHYELVKLNLREKEVRDYIFDVVKYWMNDIGIDGWRLDVAYQISPQFWKEFRRVCKTANPECFLVGEMIHGQYTEWVGPDLLDSGTSYQVYKSIWSALNSKNMHELKAVLERSFHREWGLLKDLVLVNFLGNHDTTRIRSILNEDRFIFPAFLILFTLNGIASIYYGDEHGTMGEIEENSDHGVRKKITLDKEKWPALGCEIYEHVVNLIKLRKQNHALIYGSLTPVYTDDECFAYLRLSNRQTLLIVINSSTEKKEKTIPLWNQNLDNSKFVELLQQGGETEYVVRNNQLHIGELYPCYGRILSLLK